MTIGIYNMLMESYTNMFAGFLHMNFIIRIFLFVVFILFSEIILEVLILPIFLQLIGPVMARGWNFAVTETICEYIYIKFLSDTSKVPSAKISALYNKQLKKVEKNYEYINNISEFNEAGKSRGRRRIVNRKISVKTGQVLEKFIIVFTIFFVISTFAYDFAYSKGIGKPLASNKENVYDNMGAEDNLQTDNGVDGDAASQGEADNSADAFGETGAVKYFILSEGTGAANIRTEPSFETSSVIEQVTNTQELEYMGESVPFEDNSGAEWHKIKTESGTIGWISGRIVVEKE